MMQLILGIAVHPNGLNGQRGGYISSDSYYWEILARVQMYSEQKTYIIMV